MIGWNHNIGYWLTQSRRTNYQSVAFPLMDTTTGRPTVVLRDHHMGNPSLPERRIGLMSLIL